MPDKLDYRAQGAVPMGIYENPLMLKFKLPPWSDQPGLSSLDSLVKNSDENIVRSWLAERGLVAVERIIAEKLATEDLHLAYYDQIADRYYGLSWRK